MVSFPVYMCDFMQMYFVRNDKINMPNADTISEEYTKSAYLPFSRNFV